MLIPRWLQTLWHCIGAKKRAGRFATLLLPLLACLLAAPPAHALEFEFSNPSPDGALAGVARGLTLSGELHPGDTTRLIALLRARPADAWHGLGRVVVAITGGDTGEALKMADTLASLYPHTTAATDCAGACAIVWLAGAWRTLPAGRIGLQQPAAEMSSPQQQDDPLRSYLLKQGLPAPVYERWRAARSPAAYWLSAAEVNATGTWPPYYFQKLAARCPPLEGTEESFHALRRCAARLVISQKAFAFDQLLVGVSDPWWEENRDLLRDAPR